MEKLSQEDALMVELNENIHQEKNQVLQLYLLLYSLIVSCVLYSLDERIVITCDIPGPFLQRKFPQNYYPGYIKFEGVMVNMPSYKKNILRTKDGKRKFIFGQLKKAIYGTLLTPIIFYNKLSAHLNDHGFEIN